MGCHHWALARGTRQEPAWPSGLSKLPHHIDGWSWPGCAGALVASWHSWWPVDPGRGLQNPLKLQPALGKHWKGGTQPGATLMGQGGWQFSGETDHMSMNT